MKKPGKELLKDLTSIFGSEELAMIEYREGMQRQKQWDRETNIYIAELLRERHERRTSNSTHCKGSL